MDNREFLNRLLAADKVEDVKTALGEFRRLSSVDVVPVGKRDNNRGAIEVASDPARSAIERVTNAHDAILEYEHAQHRGMPPSGSPREAAAHWLGVPAKGGLSALSPAKRQELAGDTIVRLEPGEGWQSRLLTVIDRGIGISAGEMEGTILSLNESNKIRKHYLAGTYGQGGSSTLVFSKYVAIVSRAAGSEELGFTLVWYQDLPADQYKTGRYVYLIKNGMVPATRAEDKDIERGTIVRHFGYDLSGYTSSIGPKSLYGALQRVLFDPISPIRLENRVHGWNRTIKGARNALNGAVDEGDEGSAKGPDIDYRLPIFNVSLGDHGEIGVEYWVLARKLKNDGKPSTEAPSRAFVDNTKPIVLTHNGQNQGELSGRIIQKDADLFYLQKQGRLVVHVSCDRLSPSAKRMLFSSTREQWREGFIQSTIQAEIISLLKSDDELRRLNEIARDESLRDKDDAAEKQIQRQVARLLRIVGPALAEVSGKSAFKAGGNEHTSGGGGRKPPETIDPNDPPTFIRIVADEDSAISFYAGQRRMIRLETDANSDYHDPDDPTKNRLNVVVGDDLERYAVSPISGGRSRIGVKAKTEIAVGSNGTIRVELYRPGATTLSDERDYIIIEQPKPKEGQKKSPFPKFKFEAVDGPDDDNWLYIAGDSADRNVRRHASFAEMTAEGVLVVYYSTAFPRFFNERKTLEARSPAMAQSFEQRYKLWLAVHALLKHEDDEAAPEDSVDEDLASEISRQERCRIASMAAMMAAQEVKSGIQADEEDVAAI